MKKYIQKPLAMILSFSLLMGCFTGLPFVASATDGAEAQAVDESNLFTFTDFEDQENPFTHNWDGKKAGTYYNGEENTALILNGSGSWFSTGLPDEMVTGTAAMSNAIGWPPGFAYVVGNDGYRPKKVSFQFKPVGYDSNTSFLINPLTFGGNSGKKVPFSSALGMVLNFASGSNVTTPYMSWSPGTWAGIYTPANSGTKEVFTDITSIQNNVNVDSTKVVYATRKFANSADSKESNLELVEGISWYEMNITYDWDDANSQVTIAANYSDGTNSHAYEYTVTYNENIAEAYNFGFIVSGTSTVILMDNLTLFSEDLTTHEVVGPHTAFMTAHQDVINMAVAFDINDYAAMSKEEKTALKSAIDTFFTDYAAQKDAVKNFADVLTAYENIAAMKEAILTYEASSVLHDFLNAYADVLGIVGDDLTIAPEDLAKEGLTERTAQAVTAFNEIDEELRSSVEGVAISKRLNRLNQCLGYQSLAVGDGVYTQNFEGTNDFETYAEYDGIEENLIGTITDFTKNGVLASDISNNTAYKIKTVNPDTSFTGRGQFVTVDKTLYDVMKNNGKYLSSGSFDMYYQPLYSASVEQMIVYRFQDTQNYNFFGMYGDNKGAYSVCMRDYKVTDLDAKFAGNNFGYPSTTTFGDKWYHFEFMYDSAGLFHLVINDENGRLWSYDAGRNEAVAVEERILAFGMMGNSREFYVDNVTLQFTESGTDEEIDERVAFCQKQSVRETTEMKPEKLVPYDFARIERFIDDYNALSESNRAKTPEVGKLIERFQTQMALWNTASDSKTADSFIAIYADKLTESSTLSVFNRLTVAQKTLVIKNYKTQYETMMEAAKSADTDAVVDITCVGDSLTYGTGISEDPNNTKETTSYPKQLAQKLGSGFKVNKQGIAGISILKDSHPGVITSTDGSFRGSETSGVGFYSSVATNPDIVIIMLGTNDNLVDKNLNWIPEKMEQFKTAYTDLVQSYLALDCNPTVVLATIPVTHENHANYSVSQTKIPLLREIYKEVAAEYGLSVIDISAFTEPWTTNESYFNVTEVKQDYLHFNDTGYGKLADIFADYIKAGTCISNTASACMYDFAAMDYVSVQPKVTDSIAFTYKATIGEALIKSAPVINPVMTFEMNGKVSDPVEGTLVEGTTDTYTFTYPEIMAQNMADKITATLKVGSASTTYEYSVMDYCQNILGRDAIEGYSPEQLAAIKEMIVDLVQYGAAVQTYRKEQDTLSEYLTAEQLAFDMNHGDLTTLSPITDRVTAGESTAYKWTGVSLVLKDKVNIRCKFTADDITGLGVKVRVGGQEVECDAKFVEAGMAGVYYLDFDGIYAYEYADKIEIALIDNDGVTGQVLNYSVNTYLYNMREYSDANLVSLLKEINDYGNAAAFYKQLADSTME